MTVIVTGAAGFIGSLLIRALEEDGQRVVAVDLHPPPTHSAAITPFQADLSNPSAILAAADGPAVLVHLAWDTARTPRYAAHATHVALLAGLLDAARGGRVVRVVVLGSAAEFGARSGVLAEDAAPVLPQSPYGWGKRSAFHLCRQWSADTGIPVAWLRPFVVYGPGQRGDMLIPYAVEQARLGATADFSDGRQTRDFLHVSDLVQALRLAVNAAPPGFTDYNLGRGMAVSVGDVILAIARIAGAGAMFRMGSRPRRSDEPDMQVADTRKAASELGWRALVDWETGIAATVTAAVTSTRGPR